MKAGVVRLGSGQSMEWHSTNAREELLIALEGQVRLEVEASPQLIRRVTLKAGHCVFLPAHVLHRVINRSSHRARYLYVTAPAT